MADYVSVPIRREVFEELKKLKEELGLRSYSDTIKYLYLLLQFSILETYSRI